MPLPELTNDARVKRLRWVMLGVILFSILNTLAGQPASFWANPQTAVRGDGLSIYNATNHTFEFFLGHGWKPYLSVQSCLRFSRRYSRFITYRDLRP